MKSLISSDLTNRFIFNKMKKTILCIVIVFSAFFIKAQNFNRPVPPDLPQFEFVINDSSFQENYLLTPIFIPPQNAPVLPSSLILDSMGYVLWYKSKPGIFFTDFKYHPNHQIFTVVEGDKFQVYDSNLYLVDSIKPINGFTNDSHEFEVLSNGNYLISGKSDSVVDYSGFTFNGAPGGKNTHLVGFTIQEFDASHNLVFEWNSNDVLDPFESYDNVYGYDSAAFDYCHGNAIEKDFDGHYLVSMRHFNAILKIDKNDGSIIWKLGGKNSDFTFVNDSGFSGQHDCRRLANGNISLFDNANMAATPKISRPKIYSLDTSNMTATKVWDYTTPTPYFARAMANFQLKPNNYKTIGYGFSYRPNPTLVVLDSADNIVSEVLFRDSVMSYRAVTYDIPVSFSWNRPQVTCSYVNNLLRLHAPGGMNKYVWNDGSTDSSLLVTSPGEYQVWVNHGEGMIGSLPVKVNNINQHCTVIGIEELKTTKEPVLISIFDVLGRRVEEPEFNTIYFYLYSDGTCKKRIILD